VTARRPAIPEIPLDSILMPHPYVDRATGRVRNEQLYHDRWVRALYSTVREHAPSVFQALVGPRTSRLLAFLNYHSRLSAPLVGARRFARRLKIDWSECVAGPEQLRTARQIFERQIRYWDRRPLPENPCVLTATGLIGLILFLAKWPAAALVTCVVVSQSWRLGSEFMRRDWRGGGRLSVYQWMAPAAVAVVLAILAWFPATTSPMLDLPSAYARLWRLELVLGLQGLWVVLFVYTGRSQVTGASLTWHVKHDAI